MFVPFISTILLVFPFSIVHGDLQNCNGYHEVNPPANLNDSFYWPVGWNEKQNSVPQFSANQNCTWKFKVPSGMYAYFGSTFTSNSPTTLLKLTDSRGVVTLLNGSSFNSPYFSVSPEFSVELDSTAVGYFGMRVAWFPIPITIPLGYSVNPSDMPLVLNGDTFNNVTVIRAQQRVSLVSLKPTQARNNEDVPTMRLTLVFDGDTTDAPFLGSLWDIAQSGKQMISSGASLTLVTVWPGKNLGNVAIFQDYSNVQNVTNFSGINCYLNEHCPFILDATNGPVAAIRYSENAHYLTSATFSEPSQLQVYSQRIDPKLLVTSYSSISTIESLPQKFWSYLTVYKLDKGVGMFAIQGKVADGWGTMTGKRQGVIVSKNYGVSTADQEFSEVFSSKGTSNITLTIRDAGVASYDATLRVTVSQDGKSISAETYNSEKFPQTVNVYRGNELSVEYLTEGKATRGCFIEFYFENGTFNRHSLFVALIVVIFNLY